ncbi:MAG: InlB B-repeat-containing protein, partial [Clostridiales bacterium]|nr:InlB B-repeat-containing protein [Clostridiales bacterium]
IHMYIDGYAGSSEATRVAVGSTNKYRNDVNTNEDLLKYNLTGNHGFEYYVDLSSTGLTGTHTIYLYALDTSGANTHTMFDTATVDIEANVNPEGYFDEITTNSKGTLRVIGWAFDPNSSSKSVNVYASVGGEYGTSGAYSISLGSADIERADINRVYSIDGNHGINSVIDLTDTGLSGTQTVYLYAEDLNTEEKTLIGSKSVTVPENNSPTAWLEAAVGYAGSLHIGGWAFDSDSPSESVDVEVYIGDTYITTLQTDVLRNDVNNEFSITGNHGFAAMIDLRGFDITGSCEVHVYGVDLSDLKNSEATKSPMTAELLSPYTIEYDANGGNNEPESQEKAYGIDLTLSSEKPVRKGFEFVGWNTSADGSGAAYEPGDIISTNSSFTLYAQWESALGDINVNGSLEKADVSLLLKYLAGMTELTEEQFETADFNSDGNIDLRDAAAILKEADKAE